MNEKAQLNVRLPDDVKRGWKLISAAIGENQDEMTAAAIMHFAGADTPEIQAMHKRVKAIAKALKTEIKLPFDLPAIPSALAA